MSQGLAEGWPLDQFKGIVVLVGPASPQDAGATSVNQWPACLIQLNDSQYFGAHEVGHVLGFQHTLGPNPNVTPPTLGSYNDVYCVMGDGIFQWPTPPAAGPPATDGYWTGRAPLVSAASRLAFLPGFTTETAHVLDGDSLTMNYRRTLRLRARDLERTGLTPCIRMEGQRGFCFASLLALVVPSVSIPVISHVPLPSGGETQVPLVATLNHALGVNSLTLTGFAADGNCLLEVEVTASESSATAADPAPPTSDKGSMTMTNVRLVYEDRHYADLEACVSRVKDIDRRFSKSRWPGLKRFLRPEDPASERIAVLERILDDVRFGESPALAEQLCRRPGAFPRGLASEPPRDSRKLSYVGAYRWPSGWIPREARGAFYAQIRRESSASARVDAWCMGGPSSFRDSAKSFNNRLSRRLDRRSSRTAPKYHPSRRICAVHRHPSAHTGT